MNYKICKLFFTFECIGETCSETQREIFKNMFEVLHFVRLPVVRFVDSFSAWFWLRRRQSYPENTMYFGRRKYGVWTLVGFNFQYLY
jgi:hypothetical protein